MQPVLLDAQALARLEVPAARSLAAQTPAALVYGYLVAVGIQPDELPCTGECAHSPAEHSHPDATHKPKVILRRQTCRRRRSTICCARRCSAMMPSAFA